MESKSASGQTVMQFLVTCLFYGTLVFGGETVANLTSSPAVVGIMIGGLGVVVRNVILTVFEV